jgi:uncharacterized protein (TIGR02265 family)
VDPFREPPWESPLDLAAELRRVPEALTQKGMFIIPMIAEAKRRGITLNAARDRYVPFHDYPLREHVKLLAESAQAFYPDQPLRMGLRRLGRGAYRAFMESTVGKVVWSTVNGPHDALEGILKGYEIGVPGCSARVVEKRASGAVIRLERVPYFLDSHHVGCFEGAMKAIGIAGRIRIRLDTMSSGDFLCEW